jgi:preprotein translocase subunit SecE
VLKVKEMKDKIQIVIALLIFIAGLAAFYLLSDKPMIARIGAMFGLFIVACVVGWFSEPGREFVQFGRESIDEARRVVWPTRKEAMQSTGVIFVFVFIMAIFLWIVDWSLTFGISKFIGHGA